MSTNNPKKLKMIDDRINHYKQKIMELESDRISITGGLADEVEGSDSVPAPIMRNFKDIPSSNQLDRQREKAKDITQSSCIFSAILIIPIIVLCLRNLWGFQINDICAMLFAIMMTFGFFGTLIGGLDSISKWLKYFKLKNERNKCYNSALLQEELKSKHLSRSAWLKKRIHAEHE